MADLHLFPSSASLQLEFDKVKQLLLSHCKSEYAIYQAENLTPTAHLDEYVKRLAQADEYLTLIKNQASLPIQIHHVRTELRLLSLPGACLQGDQWLAIRRLLLNAEEVFRWFNEDRSIQYPKLFALLDDSYYESEIIREIDSVLDEFGVVKDNASPELLSIRQQLSKRRAELRRLFDRIVNKLTKNGYTTEIEESYLNNRRVVAVFAEHKRQIKGILHGESDTRKTVFIEPEETIDLNNEIFSLENEERREVYRILTELTKLLSMYAPLLKAYNSILGKYDYIRARALLALDMNACLPQVEKNTSLKLIKAYHPLLYLYNLKQGKKTVPLNVELNNDQSIMIISGPNAGGKTVAMKTAGLLVMMLQSGLLVPVDPYSVFGQFRQIMVDIGDTQDLASELSTYSSHLTHMKYFTERANGKTLFLIDELGGGSDPALGGAFAEAILEALLRKHALGIVTTHYLNLKIMAQKHQRMINASMSFDEENLEPLYQLSVGKPGSSYTFSIAQRIGLDPSLIARAQELVNEENVTLDQLLTQSEQALQKIERDKAAYQELLIEQERLNAELRIKINKEKHKQELEKMKAQNTRTEERLQELKLLERKIKQAVWEWKNNKNKSLAIKNMENLLFYKKANALEQKAEEKFLSQYKIIQGAVEVGKLVRLKKSNRVATVKEITPHQKVIIQIGLLPVTVDINDIELVEEK